MFKLSLPLYVHKLMTNLIFNCINLTIKIFYPDILRDYWYDDKTENRTVLQLTTLYNKCKPDFFAHGPNSIKKKILRAWCRFECFLQNCSKQQNGVSKSLHRGHRNYLEGCMIRLRGTNIQSKIFLNFLIHSELVSGNFWRKSWQQCQPFVFNPWLHVQRGCQWWSDAVWEG
jgi:hypothetical protein